MILHLVLLGIEDEGLYRVAGVSSRVQKLTTSYGAVVEARDCQVSTF